MGGDDLIKKIVDGEIKNNNNSKKGRGVVETAPFTKFEREGRGGRESKLTTNLFAAKQGVSEGRGTATQLAGKKRELLLNRKQTKPVMRVKRFQ